MSCDSNVSVTVKAAESDVGLTEGCSLYCTACWVSETKNPWEKRKKEAETEAADLLTGYIPSRGCNRETKGKLSKETQKMCFLA